MTSQTTSSNNSRTTFFAIVHGTFAKTNHAWVLNQTFTNLTDTKEKKFFGYDRIKVDIKPKDISMKTTAAFISNQSNFSAVQIQVPEPVARAA